MSFPRMKSSAQFRDMLVSWFDALFPAKFDGGDEEHGPPGLYEKPQPLHQLREELLDGWAYLGAAEYQQQVIDGILEDGLKGSSAADMRQTIESALLVLRTGNDQTGDG